LQPSPKGRKALAIRRKRAGGLAPGDHGGALKKEQGL